MARPKDPSKKQLILDCALDLISQRGYHAVSVKDIALAAQISLGSMYTYFDSKEKLVNELFRYWKRRFIENVGLDVLAGTTQNQAEDFPKAHSSDQWSRQAHQQLCQKLGGFIRDFPKAFLFLEAQLHADYLDQESIALEHQATKGALAFYREQIGIRTEDRSPESIQVLLSASYGAFVQVFKAHVAGLLALGDFQMSELESNLWAMIQGYRNRTS